MAKTTPALTTFDAVLERARSAHAASHPPLGSFVVSPLPAAAAAWLREFVESGELRRELLAIAAADPELELET